jgi:hypothetical protein
VIATATLTDGRTITVHVEHAIGSLERPMTDAMLESKFHDLADPVLGRAKVDQVLAACWKLGAAPDLRGLLGLLTPA